MAANRGQKKATPNAQTNAAATQATAVRTGEMHTGNSYVRLKAFSYTLMRIEFLIRVFVHHVRPPVLLLLSC